MSFLHDLWFGTPKLPPEQVLVNTYQGKRHGLRRTLSIFGGFAGALLIFFLLFRAPFWLGGAAFIGGVGAVIMLIKGISLLNWKADHKEELQKALKTLEMKQQRDLRLAERQARFNSIAGELSPTELDDAVSQQAERVIGVVSELGSKQDNLINVIKQNLEQVHKITAYLAGLEEHLAIEDLSTLNAEQNILTQKLAQAEDEFLRSQYQTSLDLISRRIEQAKQLQLEDQRLRAKITAFQQAIENVRSEATHYQAISLGSEYTSGPASATSQQAHDLNREVEIMQKVQHELETIEYREERFQEDLQNMRRQHAAAMAQKN